MSLKDVVAKNDKLIRELADYDVTRGGKITLADQPIEMDAALIWVTDLQKKMGNRFAEFKSLLKRGEFTYGELESKVLKEHGIIEPLQATDELIKPPMGFAPTLNEKR